MSVELHFRGPRVLVASDVDRRFVASSRRVILMQHGAGQSYPDDIDPGVSRNPAYAGGNGQDGVDLFLVPGPHPAGRWRERYSDTPCVEVGCPALDARRIVGRPSESDTVALAFHWENRMCPETRSAFAHFLPALPELAKRWRVIGHAHPRAWPMVEGAYAATGIPRASYDEVMAGADVLVVDNSSIGFEAAAHGIPVVWLTPPWYRDVAHGLRFGPDRGLGGLAVEIRDPAELVGAVADSITTMRWRGMQVPDLSGIYRFLDGNASARAAVAIVALETGSDPTAADLEVSA